VCSSDLGHREQMFEIDDGDNKFEVILDKAGKTGGSNRWTLNRVN